MPRQSSHSTSDVVLGGCIVIATFWSVVTKNAATRSLSEDDDEEGGQWW
jgi:hypothetical protein